MGGGLVAKYLIYKDGDEVSYYRNGRDQKRGFATVEEARKVILKSRKYRGGDTIKISEV